jgi:nitrogen fixation protein NifU and related proteins
MTIDRSTPPLPSLFQELILDHYKHPRNRGELADPGVISVDKRNPNCGDEVRLQLRIRDDVIEEARFVGHGCSISLAAVSMMTQLLKGKSIDEARDLAQRFTLMLRGDADAARDRRLGDLRSLAGVSKFPVRVKCALLGFDALAEALPDTNAR